MKFRERELGRFLPSYLQKNREDTMQSQLDERQALWRKALTAAGRKKQEWMPKMHRGDGLSLEDWPELAPLTAWERTAIQVEVYKQWGIAYPLACECPRRRQGEHYNECDPHRPFKRMGRA